MKEKRNLIKDSRKITTRYLNCLKYWLIEETTAKEFFDDKNKATSFADFDYFNKEVDRDHLILPNEILLVDRMVEGEHWFVIGKFPKNKSNPRFYFLHKVVKVSDVKYWRAGYWLLPFFYHNN